MNHDLFLQEKKIPRGFHGNGTNPSDHITSFSSGDLIQEMEQAQNLSLSIAGFEVVNDG